MVLANPCYTLEKTNSLHLISFGFWRLSTLLVPGVFFFDRPYQSLLSWHGTLGHTWCCAKKVIIQGGFGWSFMRFQLAYNLVSDIMYIYIYTYVYIFRRHEFMNPFVMHKPSFHSWNFRWCIWSTQDHEFLKLGTVKRCKKSIFQKRCIFRDFHYFYFQGGTSKTATTKNYETGLHDTRLFEASVWAKPLASAWIDFADEGEDA